jgi:hypothetical protein
MLLRHGRRAITFAYLLTGDPVEAQALTTETFARLFGEFHEHRSAEDFDVRALRRIIQLQRTSALFDAIKRFVTRSPTPSDPLDRLAVRKRAALILRCFEDLTDAEIADLLLCSEGAVRSIVRRATGEMAGVSGARVTVDDLRNRFETMAAEAPSENRTRPITKGRILKAEVIGLAVIAPIAAFMSIQIALRLVPDESARPPSDFVSRTHELNGFLYDRFPPEGPKTALLTGRFSSTPWRIAAYRSPGRTLCVEIFNGNSYGAGHCVSSYTDYTRTFVSPDLNHRTTFVYGIVDGAAATVELRRKGGPAIDAPVAPAPRQSNLGRHSFFGVAIPGYLLQLDSRVDGIRLDYVMARVLVTVRDADGELIERSKILLAEP